MITIPILVVLFWLIQQWIQRRKYSQNASLSRPDHEGKQLLVVGFFHPYCNAGGGGERVLWIAIRALQLRYDIQCDKYSSVFILFSSSMGAYAIPLVLSFVHHLSSVVHHVSSVSTITTKNY